MKLTPSKNSDLYSKRRSISSLSSTANPCRWASYAETRLIVREHLSIAEWDPPPRPASCTMTLVRGIDAGVRSTASRTCFISAFTSRLCCAIMVSFWKVGECHACTQVCKPIWMTSTSGWRVVLFHRPLPPYSHWS